jgi:bacillithiol biosynthesis cysteine-adding enzyme BshC
MATEDHDFEEISAFVFQGKKFKWNQQQEGAVGKIDTASLESLLNLFEKELGNGLNASSLKKLIAASYRDQKDLTAATRVFVNHLFGKFGLVIVDGDDSILKRDFAPYAREELNKNNCHSEVLNQIEKIKEEYSATYKPQVNPREVNLFYLTPGARYRITQEGSTFHLEGSQTSFTSEEIENELANHPERFSPNVLMRPLYQEVVLPNIAYIGGGGELAYWLELKSFFNQQKVLFPLLCLRNSALLLSEKSAKKAKQLELSASDLFLKRNALINKKVRQISNIELDLSFLKDNPPTKETIVNYLENTNIHFMKFQGFQKHTELKI